MKYLVTIKPDNLTLFVEDGETVLDAALRQDLNFPYSCTSAICGTCQGQLLSGEIDYQGEEPYGLTEEDIAAGKVLFCSAVPLFDLVIKVAGVQASWQLPKKKLSFNLASIQQLSAEITQLVLNPPTDQYLNYCAGQYVYISNEQNERHPLSIANAPTGGQHLEFHIKKSLGAEFYQSIFSTLTEEKAILIEGPFGQCVFHPAHKLPVIFLAGGTGFSQCKALLESVFQSGFEQPIYLYWGVKQVEDLYLHEQVLAWQKQYDNFQYIPVIENKDKDWQGRFGLVHQAVLDDFSQLNSHQVFASGPVEMTSLAFSTFKQKGLSPYLFYSDIFDFIDKE